MEQLVNEIISQKELTIKQINNRNNLTPRARITFDKYVNKTFTNNDGDSFTVIYYFDRNNSTIIFDDGTIKENVRISLALTGQIRKPNYNKLLFGKYISGNGKFSKSKTPEIYRCWYNILFRCNSIEFQQKEPSYIGCELCEDWWNLQNFGNWYIENYISNFVIDKDILVKGNKLYSPNTCCFIPTEISNLITTNSKNKRGKLPIGVTFKKENQKFQANIHINGEYKFLGYFDNKIDAFNKYKTEKESQIKRIAEKYKNKISNDVYEALFNWIVEIND